MLLSLWNYIRGYVIIEVTGFSLERFINLAMYHNIYMWDIERKENTLTLKTSIDGFKSLKPYAKKSRCRLKIKQKKGVPFQANRYRKRKMLAFGAVLFTVLIWLLSSYVWLVEVEGNNRISTLDIIHTLEQNGYDVGKLKSKLDLREAEAIVLNTYPDVTWVGIKCEGTRLLVQIAETVQKPKMQTATNICDIVAKRDALITYIATDKGMPQVKKGDIVKKGDRLVSGVMPLGQDDPNLYYTAAKATIRGKTFYRLQGDLSLIQEQKQYTNEVAKKYKVKIFNKAFTLFNKKHTFSHYDTTITNRQLRITKLFPLPFALETEERLAYEPMQVEISLEEAKDRLLSDLWKVFEQKIEPDSVILQKDISYVQNGNTIRGVLDVIVEEEIGYNVDVQVDMQKEGETSHE